MVPNPGNTSSVCCMSEQHWLDAQRWGAGIARRMGLREHERAADLRVRVIEAVSHSWPCPHHEVLEPAERGRYVTPAERRRIRAALRRLRDAAHADRAKAELKVVDAIADAVGDEPRRRAAGSSFTSRVLEVVKERLIDPVECAVAVVLVDGVQAREEGGAARWVLGQDSSRDAASYVVGVVAGKRRKPNKEPNLLVGMSVDELVPYVVTTREALVHAFPDRWCGLRMAARAVLARSLHTDEGPDADERAASTSVFDDDPTWGHDERPVHVREQQAFELALRHADTEADFARLLDAAGRLPLDEAERQVRLRELRPLWRRYHRRRR